MSNNVNIKKFLEAYKELETELKYHISNNTNNVVLEYENELSAKSSTDAERLKVCRIMRNYMAHNDVKFLTPSLSQIEFLTSLTKQLQRLSKTAKDIAKKIPVQNSKVSIKDLIILLDKHTIVPVEYKDTLYIIDKNIIISQLANGYKKLNFDNIKKPLYYEIIDSYLKADCIDNDTIYVVRDAKKDKYVGIIYN